VVAEGFSPEVEDRVELDGDPARLVPPVLEQWFARLQQLLGKARVEASETREQHDRVAAGTGDGNRVELQVAEALDDAPRGRASAAAPAGRVFREPGPLRLEQAGAGEGQAPCGAKIERLHAG